MKPLQATDYPDQQCACGTCVRMCRQFPCRLVPEDVTSMPPEVQAQLMVWTAKAEEDRPVAMLQAGTPGREGLEFPYERIGFFGCMDESAPCVFLQDGKCELHGKCKPFEGRKAICDKAKYPPGHKDTVYGLGFPDRLSELLLEAWDTPYGRAVMAAWRKEHVR